MIFLENFNLIDYELNFFARKKQPVAYAQAAFVLEGGIFTIWASTLAKSHE